MLKIGDTLNIFWRKVLKIGDMLNMSNVFEGLPEKVPKTGEVLNMLNVLGRIRDKDYKNTNLGANI